MIAFYDLETRLPTYDYFTWLAHVKMMGATHICVRTNCKYFMRKKWPPEETRRRIDNYILPGPSLFGLPVMEGSEGDKKIGSHLIQDVRLTVEHFGAKIPRIDSILSPRTERYTVTIRETDYKPERNSDQDLWRRFGERIGARVIEDFRRVPIGLHERVALYASAEMNFGVPNGPLSLLFFSRYSLTMFTDPAVYGDVWRRQGIAVNAQVPWFLPGQRLVWQKPTMDGLMRYFEKVAA